MKKQSLLLSIIILSLVCTFIFLVSHRSQKVDTTIISSSDGNSYLNITNNFETHFKKDPTDMDGIQFKNSTSEISFFTPRKQSFGDLVVTPPTTSESTITYPTLFPSLDLKYTISSTRLLEEFIVGDRETALDISSIAQQVTLTNVDHYQEQDGGVNFYRQKELVFSLPKPILYEQLNHQNSSYGIKYEVVKVANDHLTITKQITEEGLAWLKDPSRTYPIVIDLVIDNADTAANWVSSDSTLLTSAQETTIKQEGTGSVKLTPPSTTTTWFHSAWPYRVKLTIDATKVDADLTDYPVYVNLNDLPAAFHSHVNQTDARDIRVTKSDGVTELPREVVFYTAASDTGELHLKYSGTLSGTTNTDIYLYYGNSGASDYAVTDTYGTQNVWDSNYKGVWHLTEASGTHYDSTSNNNDSTALSVATQGTANAKIGGADDFNATTSYINVGTSTSLNLATNGTLEAWIYPDGWGEGGFGSIIARGAGGGVGYEQYTASARSSFSIWDSGQSNATNNALSLSAWQHAVVSIDNNVTSFYVNGAAQGGSAFSLAASGTTTAYIGSLDGLSDTFDGQIDEVRVSSAPRSSTWVSTQYNNQNTPGTFFNAFGGEESMPNPSWYNFSWPYRLKLTIDATKVDADLTDYPVYVNLNDLPAAFHSHVNQTDARDIRVTKSDGVTELPREVVFYTAASDTGELHFKYSGTLSGTTNTDVYIYYGNSGASDYAVTATYGRNNVWTNSFVTVLHLQESGNGTTDEYVDSTGHGLDGTGGASAYPAQADAKLGKGQSFDGTNDLINVGDISAYLDLTSATPPSYTLSAWFNKPGAGGGDLGGIRLVTNSSARLIHRTNVNRQFYQQLVAGSTFIYFNTTDGNWYHTNGSFSDTDNQIKLFVNATNTTPASPANKDLSAQTMNMVIGNAQNYYYGTIDEVQVSSVDRATTWDSTKYNNQNSSSTFYTSGAETTIVAQTATRTVSATDLSSYDSITYWVRSDRTGSFMRFQFGESASSEQTNAITINSANTWEQKTWDISAITGTSRDAVTKYAFYVTDASANFNFYFDDIQATTAPSAPTIPYAEGASNPSGIIDLTPEFSAIHNDSDGDAANYYEIEVNTQSDFLGTSMWDTGAVSMTNLANAARSTDVSYAGTALSYNGTTYYWRIRFTDTLGAVGAWSATQNFSTNSPPAIPSLDSPADTATGQSLTPALLTTTTDPNSDYLRYKIELCENVGMTTNCQTFDQTVSQTGWSGQNTQTSTAYTSGTQATYTVQTPLTNSFTYYWRSYAIDPGGTNSWSSTQGTPYSFTTLASGGTNFNFEGINLENVNID